MSYLLYSLEDVYNKLATAPIDRPHNTNFLYLNSSFNLSITYSKYITNKLLISKYYLSP